MPNTDDVSYDAARVARKLDRVDPGKYVIILEKTPNDSPMGWDFSMHEITKSENIHLKRKIRKPPDTT